MRLALPPLLLLVAGCGSVLPYSLAPAWLAPDVVPEQPLSVVVVTNFAASPRGASLTGRVADRATGAPIVGAVVTTGGDRDARTGADGAFALMLSDGPVRVRVVAPGYVPAEREVEIPEGTQTRTLVLLAALAAGAPDGAVSGGG